MKCAIIFIGTSRYIGFFQGYQSAINLHFLPDHEKTFFVFTDQPDHGLLKHDNVFFYIFYTDWVKFMKRFKFSIGIPPLGGHFRKFFYFFFIYATHDR